MSLIDKIRDEIIETQKIQSEFFKWKLLLIAALGAAALGLQPGDAQKPSAVLLGLLPFVCLYADSLTYNSGIRMIAIARYLRKDGMTSLPGTNGERVELLCVRDFERFIRDSRPHFNLEVVALVGVSLGVSLVVAIIGGANLLGRFGWDIFAMKASVAGAWWLFGTGVIGSLTSVGLHFRHRAKVRMFDNDEKKLSS